MLALWDGLCNRHKNFLLTKAFYKFKGKSMNTIDNLIAYEQSELSEDNTVALFQVLIDNGIG